MGEAACSWTTFDPRERRRGCSTLYFTQKTFDNGCLDSMALTDDDYRDIGIAVVARLLALNGRTK
jgi:hypothetical protein